VAENPQSAVAAVAVAPVVPLVLNPQPDGRRGHARRIQTYRTDETDDLAELLLHKVAAGPPGPPGNTHSTPGTHNTPGIPGTHCTPGPPGNTHSTPGTHCTPGPPDRASTLHSPQPSETPGAPGPNSGDVRAAYVRYRFAARLKSLQRGNQTYSRLDTVLNLTSIAAGIAASLVAASEAEPLWTISLGVAIAACQTLSQWLKPSQRAAQRGRAALELRNEAWNILQGRDQYRGKDIDRAWEIFCRQVDRIDGRAQSQEDAESFQTATVAIKAGRLSATHSKP
jgi:hypothetical protein